ncbi:MAG: hypothetical protein K6C11_02005 [Bacilli bacterium]|nr:hypothetical protein [Bacilli bacterium]
MASKWELQRDNSTLENLKSDLSTMSGYLNNASSDVNKLYTNLDNNYEIDNDSSKAVTRAKTLETNIRNEASYITNTLMPAIDDQIRRNNEEIRRIEAEEEAERQRQRAAAASRASTSSYFMRW